MTTTRGDRLMILLMLTATMSLTSSLINMPAAASAALIIDHSVISRNHHPAHNRPIVTRSRPLLVHYPGRADEGSAGSQYYAADGENGIAAESEGTGNNLELWGQKTGVDVTGNASRSTADSSSSSSSSSLSSSSSCEGTYGFLPCTDSALGNLFLLLVYGYLMFVAAKFLSDGSELLLTVLDAGVIGGLLLPILGALPDAILILVSGLGGTKAEAQEQVLVGIGLLAGSIVMLLTTLWGGCLLLGRCDIVKDSNTGKLSTIDGTLTRPYDLTNTGVENDDLTKLSARIMIFSVIPFVIAQLPSVFKFSDTANICVLVGCVLALAGLLSYCLYQVFTPWIQERRKEIARKMLIKAGVMSKLLKKVDRASLIDDHGRLNEAIADRLFKTIDKNNDELVEKQELEFLLQVTMVDENENSIGQMADHIMQEYDVNNDNMLTREEFLNGLRKWCRELNLQSQLSIDHRVEEHKSFLKELEILEKEDEDEDEGKPPLTKPQIVRKAAVLLILGTVVAAVFADPLVDSVTEFSSATQIPSFVISFVLLPLASNSSEGVSSIIFSARKKKRNMSLTYSQIYGGVTMNCTMGLGIFLAVVYVRQLVWDFSSEVLVICVVTVAMGLVASFRKVFPTWMAGIAIALYPFSLVLVLLLDNILGWQ